jgi:hypothetical protein
MTWTHGSHTIKFGASVLDRNWSTFQVLFKANFNMNSSQTANGPNTGNAFASLLTGYYASATRNMALAAPQYKSWEFGEYVQDNWRVNNKLTVNLGLRYDVFTPITEKHNALSNFDPTDPATLASGRIQVAGAPGVSNTANIDTQWRDLQPRVGFAYTIGRGMVLRGGFGMSFWPNNVASPANLKNAPMVATYTINQPATPTSTLSTPVPFPIRYASLRHAVRTHPRPATPRAVFRLTPERNSLTRIPRCTCITCSLKKSGPGTYSAPVLWPSRFAISVAWSPTLQRMPPSTDPGDAM